MNHHIREMINRPKKAAMKLESSANERRRHERFKIRDGAYAFLRPPAHKIGQLIDISLSGLAFSYFSPSGTAPESEGLDLLADRQIYLEKIPHTLISDIILPHSESFSQITMRRRSVQFGPLTPELKASIENIIKHYGVAANNH